MTDATTPIAVLTEEIRAFATARGWEPYHSPKNLAMALASEVGELCEIFRWLTQDESRSASQQSPSRDALMDELADVANIIFLLSYHTGIDLTTAIRAKMIKNAVKYPAPATSAASVPPGPGI